MKINQNIYDFYKNKKVLVTGCTGFKGSWLVQILLNLGSNVYGYSLKDDSHILFNLLDLENKIKFCEGDIRDYDKFKKFITDNKPDIIIHLAAQPLVIDSYKDPRYTYDVNVMGTVNLCDILKDANWKCSFLNVTTDKVYFNKEEEYKYKESDPLKGTDPYSNSKSCSELVTYSYNESFFKNKKNVITSTCRSGNVIGGGDFSDNRIIPDCFISCSNNKELVLRYPESIRPYQHVLEPLFVYLVICMAQYGDHNFSSSYNVGPNDSDTIKTIEISKLFYKWWGIKENIIINKAEFKESILLMLDNQKIKDNFDWKPTLSIDETVKWTVDWYKEYVNNKNNIINFTIKQIDEFLNKIDWINKG